MKMVEKKNTMVCKDKKLWEAGSRQGHFVLVQLDTDQGFFQPFVAAGQQ